MAWWSWSRTKKETEDTGYATKTTSYASTTSIEEPRVKWWSWSQAKTKIEDKGDTATSESSIIEKPLVKIVVAEDQPTKSKSAWWAWSRARKESEGPSDTTTISSESPIIDEPKVEIGGVTEGWEKLKAETTPIIQFSLPSYVEPSHVLLGVSLPFYFRAYQLYHAPLQNLVQTVTRKKHVTMAELETADIGIRKAVASAVAGRALRLANLVSFGSFGMFGAAIFFLFDWKSVEEGVNVTRQWGKRHRKSLDELLGVEDRMDDDHPEVIARRNMTPDEESAYLAERYWLSKSPDKDQSTE